MRPQRGSRATSTTGASTCCTPRARIWRAPTVTCSSTSAGSKVPPARWPAGNWWRPRDEAVQAFFVEDGRDPEARLCDQVPLQGVRQFRRLARVVPIARAGDLAHSMRHQVARLFGGKDLGLQIIDVRVVPVNRLELRYLLVGRHAAEQVGHTCIDRQCRVAVGRLSPGSLLGAHGDAGKCGDNQKQRRDGP